MQIRGDYGGIRRLTRFVLGVLVTIAVVSGFLTTLTADRAEAQLANVGYQGRSISGAGTEPSGSGAESKLWWNDGYWWASMWDTTSGDFHIHKLDPATQTWTDTGVLLDNRSATRADTLWDGSRLYVASHAYSTTAGSGVVSRLHRYSYDPATDTYSLDTGFPVTINNYKLETLVIDKDSTGRLWATWVQGASVYVTHTLADDRTWATPFVLPAAGATGLSTDDISTVVAFGGSKVGIMWSNQNASAFYFAVHLDGQLPTRWLTTETALDGPLNVDDQINLKAHSDGRVFAAVKTSQTSAAAPLSMLLARSPHGGWTRHTVGLRSDQLGRPIVLLDEGNARVHVLATAPEAGGTIYKKSSPLDVIAFPAGFGTPFLRNTSNASMNNATSTKQSIDGATGLVALAAHKTTSFYWHNLEALPATTPPTLAAHFKATPTAGQGPLAVAFEDQSKGGATSWEWNFGDGSPVSTERNPTHTYTESGDHTVTLTVRDDQGNSDTKVRAAYISILPLSAEFSGAPLSGRVPHTVAFTDNSLGMPTSWEWDFGDGTPISTQQNPSHTYTKDGTYTVTLTVSDSAGRTSTRTRPSYVSVLPLSAEFTGTPLSGRVPLTVGFTDSTLGSPTSWRWDFGDGSPVSTQRNPSHTYTQAGTYTVTLTAADAYGNGSTRTRSAYVSVLPLTAEFTGTPAVGAAPLTVSFSDASLGSPTSWEWDFGDGSPVSSVRNPTHTYTAKGDYTITLTVRDAHGNTSTRTRASYVSALGLTADFTATPVSGAAPLVVKFTDASLGVPRTWSWDFGDSTRPSTERNPTHTYARPGTYTVTLTATDAEGDRSTKTRANYVTATSDVVLTPVADSYVKSTSPTSNYGAETSFRVKNSSAEHYRAYLRFNLEAIGGPVTSAELQLYVTDSSPYAGELYRLDAPWTESGLTWNTAPAISGTRVTGTAAAVLNTWLKVSVPTSVFASGAGTYGFALRQDAPGNSAYFSSKESTRPPQLVLKVDYPPGNGVPLLAADSIAVAMDRTSALDVLANDEPGPPADSGQSLVVDAITTSPAQGSVDIAADGTVLYTPAAGYRGADSLTYRACDDGNPNLCATATVALNVKELNFPPMAGADLAATTEDAPTDIDVLANDEPGPAEEGGQTLSVDAITSGPGHGAAEISADGTVRYTPALDYHGSDSFDYRVCDSGTPRACSGGAVDVVVASVNDAPRPTADEGQVGEDAVGVVPVVANDAPGPANEAGQSLAVDAIVSAPAHGTVDVSGSGAIRYTPAPDFYGTDFLEYRVCDDGTPRLCATSTVAFEVMAVNDAPITRSDSVSTQEDASTAIDVVVNDDPGPANESAQRLAADAITIAPQHGSAEVAPDGTVRYIPAADYSGPDAFEYRACDTGIPSACASAPVNVSVAAVNDLPVARADTLSLDEDGSGAVAPLANDRPGPDDEQDQTLTLDAITAAPAEGSVDVEADGTVRYTPAPDFYGSDSVDYRVCDDGVPRECSLGSVSVAVSAVNDPPLAYPDTATVDEDTPTTIPVLPNDEAGPANESAQDLAVADLTAPAHGTAEVVADGVRYTPAPEYKGPDSFTYRACDDAEPSLCASATVILTVTSVNDPPVTGDDSAETTEDTPVLFAVLENDEPGPTDEDGETLTLEAVAVPPEHGIAEIPPEWADSGMLRYIPAEDYNGPDTLRYRVCDDGSPTVCTTAAVTINVAAVNDHPWAVADTAATPPGRDATIEVLGNDTPGPADEAGQALTLEAVTVGAARGTAAVVSSGDDAGSVRYHPRGSYFDEDAFVYRVCDDGAPRRCATARASVSLTISATVETDPVPHSGDAADDPAIWLHPADPARSTVIGTDKVGGIAVYDLAGNEIQYRADGRMNNLDLRTDFSLDGENVTLVAASDLSDDTIALYRVNELTGRLEEVAARDIPLGYEPYGLCMYRADDGKFYAFVTSRGASASAPSDVDQWELFENGSGKVDGRHVRTLTLGSRTEGCVADDELGDLYIGEETVGIWKYAAAPDSGSDRVLVDSVGPSGQLDGDVEGLAIAYGAAGQGYLFASSQGDDTFAIYRREGDNAHVRSFSLREGGGIDGTESSDGIDVTTAAVGPSFPQGAFVAHDGENGVENQNYKLVPLERILGPEEPGDPASCGRPYSDSSPWNTPIAAAPVYAATSDENVAALGEGLTSDTGQYTYPVYEVTSLTPRETVALSGWFSQVTGGGTTLTNQRAGTAQLPIPAGAEAAEGADAQIIMVDRATGEEWGASNLERDPLTGEWIAWNAYHYNTRWDAVPPRDQSDRPFFLRGAGVPYLAGLVRPCEIARGRIEHALAFAYDYPTEAFVYPATKSDGSAWDGEDDELDSHPGDMPEGTRLQLDPTLTDAEIRAWGCTGPCLTIAHALQEYGMYVIDNSGRPKVYLEYDGTAVWGNRVDEETPAAIPLSAFKVLAPGG